MRHPKCMCQLGLRTRPASSLPHAVLPQVLQDVVRSMFDTAYVDKLFTPQEVYSLSSTRKVGSRRGGGRATGDGV